MNLARVLQEVCILLQDSLQVSGKFLNFLITRVETVILSFLLLMRRSYLNLTHSTLITDVDSRFLTLTPRPGWNQTAACLLRALGRDG